MALNCLIDDAKWRVLLSWIPKNISTFALRGAKAMRIPAGSCLINSMQNRLVAPVECAQAAINIVAKLKLEKGSAI